MILDDWRSFAEIDPGGMLDEIDQLPDQLAHAWESGLSFDLPRWKGIDAVVIAGMGGSAIGADLLQAFVAPHCRIPIHVWRNYGLPAFVNERTLVVLSSHSGNTEESLSAFERAVEIGAKSVVLSTGGELSERAEQRSIPLLRFVHDGQPRAAIGFSFGLLLATVSRLGLIPDPGEEIQDAIAELRAQQPELQAQLPVVQNPAKRLAGQLIGRWPTVIGADILAPVARRWRTQISEIAKAVAQFEELPEADHNLVAGVNNPEPLFAHTMVIFLRAASYHPRNLLRTDVTRRALMVEGFNTDVVEARGKTRMAQQWTTLHFGDYVSFYLAMFYGADPTPVPAIQEMKRELERA
jgi:glucose/mannose-6-phosphate isomerase